MEFVSLPSCDEVNQLPPRPLYHHLGLTVYWLSNSLLWGALLHLALQNRMSDWFSEHEVGYYLGIIGAVGGIVGTSTQVIVGAFSDRSLNPWGRRRPFLAAGVTLGTGALMLLGASRSFWPFAGALVLVQLCTNAALGPFTALLPDTVNPREHGKASGLMGLARLVGDVGGLILAGVLLSTAPLLGPGETESELPRQVVAQFHDHRFFLMCAAMAGFMVLTMLYTVLAIREKPLRQRPQATPWQTILRSFQVDVRGNPDFFWLSLSRGVTNVGFYMFLEILFLYLKFTMNVPDPNKTSMALMLPAIGAAAVSSVPSGLLSDRIGRRRLVLISQLLMAGGAALFIFARNLTPIYIATIPAGLAYGVFTAVEWAFACNLLPRGEAARYLGVWNASAVVPQILAFPIAGAIGSALSTRVPGLGWRVDFGVTLVCCLVGAYFLRFVHERRETA